MSFGNQMIIVDTLMNINTSNITGNNNKVSQNNGGGNSNNRWYYIVTALTGLIALLFSYIRYSEDINSFIINLFN